MTMSSLLHIIISVTMIRLSLQESELQYYDIRSFLELHPPKTRQLPVPFGECGNTAAFALVDALEISNQLMGNEVEFAVQEIIDCYYKGCEFASLPQMVEWFKSHDRLAPVDEYSPYGVMKHTCRSAVSPDALVTTKLGSITKVNPEDAAETMLWNLFVIACYDHTACNIKGTYRSGVVTGPSSVECSRYVLIIGYTPDQYIVRDSLSPKFGEGGYFRIKRGNNVCGIESNIYSVNVLIREAKPGIDANSGCPIYFSTFCPKSRVCTLNTNPCLESSYKITQLERRVQVSYKNKPSQSQDKKCQDRLVSCPRLKRHCNNKTIRSKCQFTCGVDPSECSFKLADYQVYTATRANPSKGYCHVPAYIPNGKVSNTNKVLTEGEVLEIECHEGYVLAGHPMTCEVQDVFGPDSRLNQTCVKANTEHFTASGLDYIGHKNTNQDGLQCQFWLELFHDGKDVLREEELQRIQEAVTVNHNYCRNWVKEDGHPVPYCYIRNKIHYCFPLPRVVVTFAPPRTLHLSVAISTFRNVTFQQKLTRVTRFARGKDVPKSVVL